MLVNPFCSTSASLPLSLTNLIGSLPRVAYHFTRVSMSSSVLTELHIGSLLLDGAPRERFPRRLKKTCRAAANAEIFLAAFKGNPLATREGFFLWNHYRLLSQVFQWAPEDNAHLPYIITAQSNLGIISQCCIIWEFSAAEPVWHKFPAPFNLQILAPAFVFVPWQVTLLWYFFPGGVKLYGMCVNTSVRVSWEPVQIRKPWSRTWQPFIVRGKGFI